MHPWLFRHFSTPALCRIFLLRQKIHLKFRRISQNPQTEIILHSDSGINIKNEESSYTSLCRRHLRAGKCGVFRKRFGFWILGRKGRKGKERIKSKKAEGRVFLTRQRVYASENKKSYSINSGFPFLPASGGAGAETDKKFACI